MASYQTLPVTEEQALQKSSKPYKKVVAGIALAAFVLGALAATAAKTSSHGNTALSTKPELTHIQLKGTNKCLDILNDKPYNGAPVQIWDCADYDKDGWTNKRWDTGKPDLTSFTFKYYSDNDDTVYCLDAGTNGAGGKSEGGLMIWSCGKWATDHWYPDQYFGPMWGQYLDREHSDWNGIRLVPSIDSADHKEGLCVDVPGGDTENGNQLWLYECSMGNPNQNWVGGQLVPP